MTVTFERREGRLTVSEYRVVVTVGATSAAGPWQYTKRAARADAEAVRRSLFDAEEAGRRLDAGSRERCDRIRTQITHDRRIRLTARD